MAAARQEIASTEAGMKETIVEIQVLSLLK